MAQLSPKQYIQTKARSLPVYKCLVNADWETARLANIIVMRRHVNGNVTAGFFLVDLLCLGVKDTIYFFNEPEAAIEDRLGGNLDTMFTEADYGLVHNIVYAGHDFAMDFEIKPHADFAVTKFILEEDNDDVPLVEIEVGEDDKPHLIVHQPGQYSDALAKLKKHAGEGNYNYTVSLNSHDDDFEDEDYDEDEDFDDEEDNEEYDDIKDIAVADRLKTHRLDDYAVGSLSPFDAQFIRTRELYDDERMGSRSNAEQLTLHLELTLRTLKETKPALFANDNNVLIDDDEFFENGASGVTEQQELDFKALEAGIVTVNTGERNIERQQILAEIAEKNSENPLVVTNIFEALFLIGSEEYVNKVKGYVEKLSPKYPVATLMLALCAIYKDSDTGPYRFIYESNKLSEAFPDDDELGIFELSTYSLIQILVKLNNNDVKLARYYYYFNVIIEMKKWIFPIIQMRLAEHASKEIKASE